MLLSGGAEVDDLDACSDKHADVDLYLLAEAGNAEEDAAYKKGADDDAPVNELGTGPDDAAVDSVGALSDNAVDDKEHVAYERDVAVDDFAAYSKNVAVNEYNACGGNERDNALNWLEVNLCLLAEAAEAEEDAFYRGNAVGARQLGAWTRPMMPSTT